MSSATFSVRFGSNIHTVPYGNEVLVSNIPKYVAEQWKLPFSMPSGKFWLCNGSHYVVTPEQANSKVTETDLRSGMTVDLDFLGPSLTTGLKKLRIQRYKKKNSSNEVSPLAALAKLLNANANRPGTSSQSAHDEVAMNLPVLNMKPIEGNDMSIRFWAAELFSAMENPTIRARISQEYPQLVESYLRDKNFEHFEGVCRNLAASVFERKKKMADPTSAEGQKHLLKMIKMKRIQEALMRTHEFHPELLVPTTMLYINMTINDVLMPIMIDSGAQSSIMSSKCARDCNIFDDIDETFKSTAFGVGGANHILGRVHLCDVRINGVRYPFSFDVIKSENYLMLFGLNMMKTLGCHIDLKGMKFVFGDGNETPFLSDAAVVEHNKNHREDNDAKVDEELLTRLTSMGFAAARARTVLGRTGNQFELALQILASDSADGEKMDVEQSKSSSN